MQRKLGNLFDFYLLKKSKIRPVESPMKNYETMKSYQITGKFNNVSIVLIKKHSLIRVFIYLDFRTCILLLYRKATYAKMTKQFFSDISKAEI